MWYKYILELLKGIVMIWSKFQGNWAFEQNFLGHKIIECKIDM